MKKGFTTGTAATCAAVAHCIYQLEGIKKESINIVLPKSISLEIPVNVNNNYACVIKDAGDDPDVTNGLEICAKVKIINNSNKIIIKGGKGVGIVTKAGLQISIGEPAINPVPRKMIEENLQSILPENTGAEVTIFVPRGKEIAEKTFNERIGIVGGISIIGTTGIVEPMSLDAIIATIKCEIDVLVQEKTENIAVVPGKIGEKHLRNIYPNTKSVIVSNYFEEAFDYLLEKEIDKITLAGHPGKLAKLTMGYYNTHSKKSPMANKFVAKKLNLKQKFNTVEEICNICKNMELNIIANLISQKIKSDYPFQSVSVILFDMKGNLVGKFYEK